MIVSSRPGPLLARRRRHRPARVLRPLRRLPRVGGHRQVHLRRRPTSASTGTSASRTRRPRSSPRSIAIEHRIFREALRMTRNRALDRAHRASPISPPTSAWARRARSRWPSSTPCTRTSASSCRPSSSPARHAPSRSSASESRSASRTSTSPLTAASRRSPSPPTARWTSSPSRSATRCWTSSRATCSSCGAASNGPPAIVLSEQGRRLRDLEPAVIERMHGIKDIGRDVHRLLVTGRLDRLRRAPARTTGPRSGKLASKMTDEVLDELHEAARGAGRARRQADGAGGGGFFMFYVRPDGAGAGCWRRWPRQGLRVLRFRFDLDGARIGREPAPIVSGAPARPSLWAFAAGLWL